MKRAFSIFLGVILCFAFTTINGYAADASLDGYSKHICGTFGNGISVIVDKGVSSGKNGTNSGFFVGDKDTVTVSPGGVSYDGFWGSPILGFHESVKVGFPSTDPDPDPTPDPGTGTDPTPDPGTGTEPGTGTIVFPSFPDISVNKNVSVSTPVMLVPCVSFITLDGKPISLNVYTLVDAKGGATNFVMLRDIACILSGTPAQFDVSWNKKAGISATPGAPYTKVGGELSSKGQNVIGGVKVQIILNVNGKPHKTEAYNIKDNNYVKLRDIAKILNFNVSWCNHTQIVLINSSEVYNNK